jgi:hypothetical protein
MQVTLGTRGCSVGALSIRATASDDSSSAVAKSAGSIYWCEPVYWSPAAGNSCLLKIRLQQWTCRLSALS